MSVAQYHAVLANSLQELQAQAAGGSLPAMTELSRRMRAEQMQQMQAGLTQQMQPPVKDQLMQVAAQNVAPKQQPEQSGIAMAAGGRVRSFSGSEGSWVGTDETPMTDRRGDPYEHLWHAHNSTEDGYQPESQASGIGKAFGVTPTLVAKAMRYITGYDRSTETPANAEKRQYNPPATAVGTPADTGSAVRAADAATKNVAPKSGIAGAMPQSGPTGYRGSTNPNAGGDADKSPEETNRDRADALATKLDPLYAKQRAVFTDQADIAKKSHAGLQDAKKLSTGDELLRMGQQLSRAAYNDDGTPAINHGIADIGRYGARDAEQRQKARLDAIAAEAKHQITLSGINSGATDAEIKQALAQYNLVNGAVAADDKSEINWFKAEAKKAADEKKAEAAAAKAAKGIGAGGPKSMTEAQMVAARNRIEDVVGRMKDDMGMPASPAAMAAERARRYAAAGITQLQSTPAPTANNGGFKVIGSRPSQ